MEDKQMREAKEKGRYAITTMRGDQGVSENRAAKK